MNNLLLISTISILIIIIGSEFKYSKIFHKSILLIGITIVTIIIYSIIDCRCTERFQISVPFKKSKKSKKSKKELNKIFEEMYDDDNITYDELCQAVPKYKGCNLSMQNKLKSKVKSTLKGLIHVDCNTGLIGRAYGIDGVLYRDWIRTLDALPGISPPPNGSGPVSKNMWNIMEEMRPGWLD